jgi:hypothetical protein
VNKALLQTRAAGDSEVSFVREVETAQLGHLSS